MTKLFMVAALTVSRSAACWHNIGRSCRLKKLPVASYQWIFFWKLKLRIKKVVAG